MTAQPHRLDLRPLDVIGAVGGAGRLQRIAFQQAGPAGKTVIEIGENGAFQADAIDAELLVADFDLGTVSFSACTDQGFLVLALYFSDTGAVVGAPADVLSANHSINYANVTDAADQRIGVRFNERGADETLSMIRQGLTTDSENNQVGRVVAENVVINNLSNVFDFSESQAPIYGFLEGHCYVADQVVVMTEEEPCSGYANPAVTDVLNASNASVMSEKTGAVTLERGQVYRAIIGKDQQARQVTFASTGLAVGGPNSAIEHSAWKAGSHIDRWNLYVSDPEGLLDDETHQKLLQAGQYGMKYINTYVAWEAPLDVLIKVEPHEASPFPDIEGIMPSVVSFDWTGSAFSNNTLIKATTGVDRAPGEPDGGMTIYLAPDGQIRNFGAPIWFDPSPQCGVAPEIPAGHTDFIGVFVHELFHGLGFAHDSIEFQDITALIDGNHFITSSKTEELYGAPLPLAPTSDGGLDDHYGNVDLAENRVESGLLFQFGNYNGNRLDIGQIDLAVLEDLGHTIRTYEGLPLFDRLDHQLASDQAPYTCATNP
ncbi:MAG TPA: hypothetical protein VIC53_06065 [Wenzhouxiangella sp.]